MGHCYSYETAGESPSSGAHPQFFGITRGVLVRECLVLCCCNPKFCMVWSIYKLFDYVTSMDVNGEHAT